ncbi:MAG: hypothetical protein ABWY05_08425, partial [Noviherbaspirillum sp.]
AASGWLAALAASAGIGLGGMALLWLAPAAGWVALSAWLARRQEALATAGKAGAVPPSPNNITEPSPRSADEIHPK